MIFIIVQGGGSALLLEDEANRLSRLGLPRLRQPQLDSQSSSYDAMKAYPALRQFAMAPGVGLGGIVGSIDLVDRPHNTTSPQPNTRSYHKLPERGIRFMASTELDCESS